MKTLQRFHKSLLEAVVDAVPVVLALLDADERVVLDNHEYKTLMGDLRMAEPAALILDAVRADGPLSAAQDGAPAFAEREIRIDARGAWRWFSCSGTWVEPKDGGLYLLLVAKETTRSRAEHERTRVATLQALMADENRIDTLRETLSAAVFQLEGPFNVMNSVTGTIARRGCCEAAGTALVEALAAGQAAVANLRGAIPEHAPEAQTAVNLNEVLRDVLDLATQRLLAAGIGVHWRPQAVLPSVNGQARRLRAMFLALVDNAIEAMNAKGWKHRELTLSTHGTPSGVEVVIADSGPGIAAELRLKVFEPFYSTRKGGGRHQGTGLSAAQQIAADHDGAIEIGATDAGGCRVRVVLPANGRVEAAA